MFRLHVELRREHLKQIKPNGDAVDKLVIAFSSEVKEEILDAFGKKINQEGFIVESGTNNYVYTPEGEKIPADSFAGITKGSVIYVKSDLISLISLADRLRKNNALV